MAIRDPDSKHSYERVVRENLFDRSLSCFTNRLTKPGQYTVPTDKEKTKGFQSCCGVSRDWWNFHPLLVSFLRRADCSQVW